MFSLPCFLSFHLENKNMKRSRVEGGKRQSKRTEHAWIFLYSCHRVYCWQWQNFYKTVELVLTDGRFASIYICSDAWKGPKYSGFLSQSKKMLRVWERIKLFLIYSGRLFGKLKKSFSPSNYTGFFFCMCYTTKTKLSGTDIISEPYRLLNKWEGE